MWLDRSMLRPAKAGWPGSFKSNPKKRLIQIVLVFLISFALPLLSAYFDFCDLSEADFLSRDICIENPDQDNLLIDQHNESRVLTSEASTMRFPPEIDLLEQFPLVSFIKYSLDPETFILRC
jgi:hypothetical protein